MRALHRLPMLAATLLLSTLAGCMSLDQVPRAERDPIYGLGQSAARLIAEQRWTPRLSNRYCCSRRPRWMPRCRPTRAR